jgi:hypothetical protein
MNNVGLTDNGNRRFGNDRREFSYTAYLPERRSGKDRRDVFDYRNIQTNENRSDIGTCGELAEHLINYKFLLRRAFGQSLTLD